MDLAGESFTLLAATDDLGDAEAALAAGADGVEFRLDLAADPLASLDGYGGAAPLLVTNRAEWEGGAAEGPERLDSLAAALDNDAVAGVDVELAALRGESPDDERERAQGLVTDARDRGLAVVVSVHDFEGTASPAALVDRLTAAATAGDVGKLATRARSRSDALASLRATHEAAAAGHAVATMCMGDPGRHTRAVAPLYGSRIGYAPVDPEDATAPGQYDCATLARLVETVGGRDRAALPLAAEDGDETG